MKRILLITFTFLTLNLTHSQLNNKSCECVKNTYTNEKVDTVFHFTNGKNIVLCGFRNDENNIINYSEFVLYVCKDKEIINFWDAMQTCNIELNNDTLYVEELVKLPNGKNFKFEDNIWRINKYYFSGDELKIKSILNEEIKKYDDIEIKTVLKEFEYKQKGLDDSIIILANKLFICSLSGNKIAKQYFIDLETKFGILDGGFKEEYYELKSMLENWDINITH